MAREDVTGLFPSRSKVAEPLLSRRGDLRFDPLPSIFLGRSPSLM
jgi:hypothetical protein